MTKNIFDLAIEDLLLSAGLDPVSIKHDDGAEISRAQLEAVQMAYIERKDYFNAVFGTKISNTSYFNLTRPWKASVEKHWGIAIHKRKPGAAADKNRPVRYFKSKVSA